MSAFLVDSILSTAIPRRCMLCRRLSDDARLCRACTKDMPWWDRGCDWCGRQLPDGYSGRYCGVCDPLDHRSVQVFSALSYEYPVDQLIIGAKFRCLPVYASATGDLLASSLRCRAQAGLLVRPDILVPVPLHRTRLAWRGFNQSSEISQVLSHTLNFPIDEKCCRRTKVTHEQSGLSGAERRRNVHDAFSASDSVAGKNIAIVDDVLTTGHTVTALISALRRSGADQLQVWTVARARYAGAAGAQVVRNTKSSRIPAKTAAPK